eukprot:1052270-Pleurochrysis_carterae.AAC.2
MRSRAAVAHCRTGLERQSPVLSGLHFESILDAADERPQFRRRGTDADDLYDVARHERVVEEHLGANR